MWVLNTIRCYVAWYHISSFQSSCCGTEKTGNSIQSLIRYALPTVLFCAEK